ncbi:hypothetical protein Poly21_13800 [Allorhodopirellula heiligendammensis]|uniref:Uncharacterized protein n=1 Tax=Allorhodopirellula heiligendammensis TaxID=2714739 RepID=A0A5C6C8W5_9BACT|nr:hypothetical protein Poly21_13800 [Allorhodopirellula heiligendammensis]
MSHVSDDVHFDVYGVHRLSIANEYTTVEEELAVEISFGERIHVSPRFDGWEPFVKKLATQTRDLGSLRLPVTFAPPTKHME